MDQKYLLLVGIAVGTVVGAVLTALGAAAAWVEVGTAVGTLATALFTAIAAAAALRSVTEAARSAKTSELLSRKLSTIKHITSKREHYQRLPRRIHSYEEKADQTKTPKDRNPWEEKRHTCLQSLFAIWEHIATGINVGSDDIEVLHHMTGSRILNHYKAYAHFVRGMRRDEGPRKYDQLDILVDRLLEIQSSEHLITRDTLRQLKANHVPADTRRRLKALRNIRYKSDRELLVALVQKGLEREKGLISTFSRRLCYSVEPYSKGDYSEVRELFISVQKSVEKSTHGYQWPPVDVANEPEFKDWLFVKGKLLQKYVVCYREPTNYQWLERLYTGWRKRRIVGFVTLMCLHNEAKPEVWEGREGILGEDWKKLAFRNERVSQNVKLNHVVAIDRLAVHPDFCSTGIGRMVLRHAIRTVQQLGPSGVEADAIEVTGGKRQPTGVAVTTIPIKLESAIALCKSEGGLEVKSRSDATYGPMKAFVF